MADLEENYDEGNRMYEEAEKCLGKALEMNKNDYRRWNNKGLVLYCLNRYDEALSCFDFSIRLNYNSWKTWCNRGFTLYNLKKYDEALVNIDKSLVNQIQKIERMYKN